MCACALNKRLCHRPRFSNLRTWEPGVLMAGTLGCLSPGTYSEAGPKFQGWRPRLTPKETNELSSRDRPGSRRAVAVGLIAESVMPTSRGFKNESNNHGTTYRQRRSTN